MIPFDEALAIVLAEARPLGAETVALDDSPGRILAEDVAARWDLPPFDNSAMDGYAVRAASTATASREHPLRLRLCGRIYADAPAERELEPRVEAGTAAYITTGARVPNGADAVVRQEATASSGDEVLVLAPVAVGENVRNKGEDTPAGRILLPTGYPIDPPAVAILATFGYTMVPVGRRPRVAILSTGDELIDAEKAQPGRIVDSNSHVALALAKEAGALATRLGIAPDLVNEVAARISTARVDHDVVVTLAGSSMGEHDVTKEAFAAVGVDLRFWNVAMKPGKPVGFGRLGSKLFFALPGNPAAAATTFDLLVGPALRAMTGAREVVRPTVRGRLASPARKQPGLTYFLRGNARIDGGIVLSLPAFQGSGQLTPTLGTNAYAILPRGQTELLPGDEVDVQLLAPPIAASSPPVVCVVGPSGIGKTTLLTKVLARLVGDGLRVGALKHDAHEFQLDHEGKDTFRFRAAGAQAIGIASKTARAMIATTERPTSLRELVTTLPTSLDLVLVEGYKNEDAPKIEVHRRGRPLLWQTTGLSRVIAVVSDDETAESPGPRFAHEDIDGVCALLRSFVAAS